MEINSNYLEKFKDSSGPKHNKAVLVDEILEVVGKSKFYQYGFWLKKIKCFELEGGEHSTVRQWLGEIKSFPGNFNKGAILTNKFKEYGRK